MTERVLDRLTDRLTEAAEAEGLVDLAYRRLDTAVGTLLLVATERGLVRVAFEREGFDTVLQQLADKISPRILAAPRRLDAPAKQLDEYLTRRRERFSVALDRRLSTGFRGEVQTFLPEIAYGRTMTYREVAAELGRPAAVRAVGSACATNPLPIVVPCHRVLRTDGTLGGYLGGLETKTALLELERTV